MRTSLKWVMLSFLLLIIGGILFLKPNLTGRVLSYPAQPGNITVMNITFTNPYWYAYRGQLETLGGIQFNATGDDVENISVFTPCDASLISLVYFSTTPFSDATLLTNASGADIDAYLGVSSSDSFSGTSTFNETNTFDIIGNQLKTVSLRTKAPHAKFQVGAFKLPNSSLVFAATVVADQSDYAGDTSDFQIVIPMNAIPTPYYTSVDPNDCLVTQPKSSEETKKKSPYLFPGLKNDSYPDIEFPEQPITPSPTPPEITPPILPENPIKADITSTWDEGYVLDIHLIGLDKEIEVTDMELDGDAKNFFRLRSDRANFFIDNSTKIFIDPLADLPAGRYPGILILRHNKFGELSIPFEIVIPEKTRFTFSWLIVALVVLIVLAHLAFRKYQKKKQDRIDQRLEMMKKQLELVKKMKK